MRERQVALPPDDGLPGFPSLFDGQWAWGAYCQRYGEPKASPVSLAVQQLRYRPGRRALVSYIAEWPEEEWQAPEQFAVDLRRDGVRRVFRFPEDPSLPGLADAVAPEPAAALMSQYLGLYPKGLRADVVRYRPTSRAVLRYRLSTSRGRGASMRMFARVMRPSRVPRLMTAGMAASRSTFATPRLLGRWDEGGVVWMAKAPGKTVRSLAGLGQAPAPDVVLNHLASLWRLPVADGMPSLDLAGDVRATRDLLGHLVRGTPVERLLGEVAGPLERFASSWSPSGMAHNDFYDDQVIVTPAGELALVDFEEMGPGDPIQDAGTMLAHLSTMARRGGEGQAYDEYYRGFRAAALERLGCGPRALDLREATALFSLSTFAVRRAWPEWLRAVEQDLGLAAEVLARA